MIWDGFPQTVRINYLMIALLLRERTMGGVHGAKKSQPLNGTNVKNAKTRYVYHHSLCVFSSPPQKVTSYILCLDSLLFFLPCLFYIHLVIHSFI
jgi:hypothetical protein